MPTFGQAGGSTRPATIAPPDAGLITAPSADPSTAPGDVPAAATPTPTGGPTPQFEATGVGSIYSTTHDTALVVGTEEGVLAGEPYASGSTLTVELVTAPASGTLDLDPDGAFVYEPAAGYVGGVTFEYEVFDGSQSLGSRTAYISVENAVPYTYGQRYEVTHDQPLSGQLLAVDDGDPVTFSITQQPASGSLDLDPDTGDFVYTPETHFIGTVTFGYEATDGIAAGEADVVTIQVTNYRPESAPDAFSGPLRQATESLAGGDPVSPGGAQDIYGDVLVNDRDYDDDDLTVELTAAPSHGTFVLSPNGFFTYTPDTGFAGEDVFWYRATDGVQAGDPVPVTVFVPPEAPLGPIAMPAALTTTELEELTATFRWAGETPVTELVSGLADPAAGTLTLASDGLMTFTPAAGYTGFTSFRYRFGDGTAWSPPAIVWIRVFPVPVVGRLGISDGGETGDSIAGAAAVPEAERRTRGAATVANKNDTDADGKIDNAADELDIRPLDPLPQGAPVGFNERDMMLLRLQKPTAAGGAPLPALTQVRAIVTSGAGKLWKFHIDPNLPQPPAGVPRNAPTRQSKQSGEAANLYTLNDFDADNEIKLYLEATDASSMQGIAVEYQYRVPGGPWRKLDEVRATGVWVTKSQVNTTRTPMPFTDPPPFPATLVNENLQKRLTSARALDGSYFGMGPFEARRVVPLAPFDFSHGGRILFDFTVSPARGGELVNLDVTRRIKAASNSLDAGTRDWVDTMGPQGFGYKKQFPARADGANDDADNNDEQNDSEEIRRISGIPVAYAGGHLYSMDAPGARGIGTASTSDPVPYGFIAMRMDFREFVRLKPKSQGAFAHSVFDPVSGQMRPKELLVGGWVEGSRASSFAPWHFAQHLRWDGSKFVPDQAAVSVSASRYFGVGGPGTMTVEAVGAPPTEGITATYTVGLFSSYWTVSLASPNVPTQTIPAGGGTVEFTSNGVVNYRVTIGAQPAGAPAYQHGDKFLASVYKTLRPDGKLYEIAEGVLADVTTN